MAINWPNAPTDGQEHTEQGQTWRWDATAGVWVITSGTSAEFLSLSGGTLTGPLVAGSSLNVVGGFVAENQATFQAGVQMDQGLTSDDEIIIDKVGDKGVTFQSGGGVTEGRVGWIGAGLALLHGAVTKLITTATGVTMKENLQVDGNLSVTGSTTLGGAPTADLEAATKKYVDDQFGGGGGDFTVKGDIIIQRDPDEDDNAQLIYNRADGTYAYSVFLGGEVTTRPGHYAVNAFDAANGYIYTPLSIDGLNQLTRLSGSVYFDETPVVDGGGIGYDCFVNSTTSTKYIRYTGYGGGNNMASIQFLDVNKSRLGEVRLNKASHALQFYSNSSTQIWNVTHGSGLGLNMGTQSGGTAITGIWSAGSGTGGWHNVRINTSSKESKTHIKTLKASYGLGLIEQLRPVTFNSKGFEPVAADHKNYDPKHEKYNKPWFGLILEEVEQIPGIEPLLGWNGPTQSGSVDYATLTIPLVKAVQELSQQVKDLKAEVESLKNQP